MPQTSTPPDAEYIVVGSGAGGGTVAARLAESRYTVLLLEAGADPREGEARNTDDYDVPAFHPFATENERMRWDFFVRHYGDAAQQRRDPKYVETWNNTRVDGVWYPRTGALGGCTSHNAMILIYPHNADWNELADLTSDPSWRADRMRTYFERLEDCRHRALDRALGKLGINPSRHGWGGWLPTERAVPLTALARDNRLLTAIIESARAALATAPGGEPFDIGSLSEREGDPNDWRRNQEGRIGVRYTPLTTRDHVRVGARERVLDVRRRHPDHLTIRMNALATRVLFDAGNRAIGVEYLEGERLYRAHAHPDGGGGQLRQVYASREVILSGGAFNTPQLLMLSGVGPAAELQRHGIPVRVPLAGVGQHLQDRYEVAVVNRAARPWEALDGATFTRDDPHYREWAHGKKGVYTTNGALLSIVLRSSLDQPMPDLFCYAVIAKFAGYVPGYSKDLQENPDYLTWVVLKGHTANTGGVVTLASPDPRDPPRINFHYFDEGSDPRGEDLDAVVAGVEFIRKVTEPLKRKQLIAREEQPGEAVQSREALRQFVRDTAWGHHASCTCHIGARDRGGVLSSDFKVHGTEGLRVVDASVFPRVPGLFIVSAVYMIGEKAADTIVADAKRNAPAPRRA